MNFRTYTEKANLPWGDSYRYQLTRGTDKKVICFLMLNPSIADQRIDDPTIRRCKGFMHSLGYTGLIVVNLFPLVATKPASLYEHIYKLFSLKLTEREKMHLNYAFYISKTIVAAYGVLKFEELKERAEEVCSLDRFGKPIYALKLTKKGFPSHPLYLKKDLKPDIFFKK